MERLLIAVYAMLLALMYLVPYTMLRDAGGWLLYSFWAALGIVALAVSWAATRGWGGGGG